MSSQDESLYERTRDWVREHKLRTVGTLWATALAGSIAWNFSKPEKRSVKIIHARIHAQMLTLAALAGSGLVEYYDRRHKQKKQEEHQEHLA